MADPRISIGGDASGLEKAVNIAKGKLGELETALPNKGMAAFSAVTAALGVTLTTGSFIAGIKNAVDSLDSLGEAAESAGVSIESLQALRYAATFAGVGADQLQKSLEVLSSKLASAAAGGKEAQETFRVMGINFRNSSGQLLQTDEALAKIADKFAGYRDGAEKTALAAEVFGQKIGPKLIPFLNQGSAGIDRLRQEAEKLGLVFDGQTVKAASDFNDQLDRLKLSADAAFKSIALDVIPFLTKTAEEFIAARKASEGFFGALGLLAKQSAETLADPGQKISELSAKLKTAQDDLANYDKAFFTFGSKRDYEQRIEGIKRELDFLRELQRNRALAASAGQDLGDQVSRGQRGGVAAPVIGKPREPREPQDLPASVYNLGAVEREIQERLNKVLDSIDEAERKAADKNAEIAERYIETWTRAVEGRVDAVRRSVASDAELENERFRNAQDALQAKLEADVTFEEEFRRLSEDLERQHQEALTDIQDRELMRRFGIQQVYRKLDIEATRGFLAQVSLLMNTQSRSQFEIGKAAAIGLAIVDTYKAATGAYAALASIPYVGPFLGAAAAAAAIAAGIANVQKIKAAQFGGGPTGGAAIASVPTSAGGLSPTGVDPTAQIGRAAPAARRIEIHLEGQSFSAEQVRELIEEINEQGDYGAEITIRRG